MSTLTFFSGGINGEANCVDACDEFLVYASGLNLVYAGQDRFARPFPDSHTGYIHSVAISKGSQGEAVVVSASCDKTVKIWTKEGQLLHTVQHSHGFLYAKGYVQMGKIIAYDDQGTVLWYELLNGLYSLKHSVSYGPKKVHSLALSPEEILAVGTSDRLIRLLVVEEGKLCQVLALPGHSNWVTCLDWSLMASEGYRLLASCGPDKSVRLWKLKRDDGNDPGKKLIELIPAKNSFAHDGARYIVENESILYGHEGTVNSCHWAKTTSNTDVPVADLRLVTSSADSTLIIWALGHALWNSEAHIGDISGSASVGCDRSFGFFSGLLTNGGKLIAHSSNGGLQFWGQKEGSWLPETPLTGHFGPVQGCAWDREGRFLLTTSSDQTTRAYAPDKAGGWFEVGRPQIHGYDLQCIAAVDSETFMSGADEKVIRVFQMPPAFKTRLEALQKGLDFTEGDAALRPTMVPALGLSNKTNGESEGATVTAEMPLGRPPTESDLSRHTLWPEIDKLYAHGYELFSLAVNREGTLAASAAKASLSADAGIRFWARYTQSSSVHWTAVPNGHVIGHSLTIVDLKFSPSGHYLLATSRDRTWSIIEVTREAEGAYAFNMIQREEAHGRIIWAGAWESDDRFVTVSRDKTVKFWYLDPRAGRFTLTRTIELQSGVTSVDISAAGLMAVGEESGKVTVYRQGQALCSFSGASEAITDIEWRPGHPDQLAFSSKDRSVRIFAISS